MCQFVCTTCGYPSRRLDGCDNPACLANPGIPESHKQIMRERAAKAAELRRREEERRVFKDRLRKAGFTVI